ncbi:hypothetical protein SYNTR_2051 [Candidatus Syntrophocurvum alkaliphilum]|uniref:DUF2232 domain-containing protein n=1 Tax=Candidatus Syntrophocurvum alkaliphilum TaxID=2293317 RepID=A0A6I6DDJ4_9FIRM|nr:DUF2232 domain-containing protein [Candidatus Syntrophocurvum alkaliphilum]QGU00645.1 hypothetical protein SYNTR_2051 [Candidatus Syntrophocurvum alkaliphilum]
MSAFVLLVLISLLACIAMIFLPVFSYIAAIIWGVALIFSGFKLEKNQIIIIFGTNILLLFGLTGDSTLFFYLLFFGLPAIVMSILANKQKGYYELQKWGIASAVIGVTLFMTTSYLILGDIGINEFNEELNNYMEESIVWYEESGLLEVYEDLGITKDEIVSTMEDLFFNISRHLPAIYFLQAIFAVFLMLYLTLYLSKKRDLNYLEKRPFTQEIMPWQLVWVFILALSLWLFGREDMAPIYFVGSNIIAVKVPIIIYFGLAAILYRIQIIKSKLKTVLIIILVLLTMFLPLSIIVFLTLIGLFDALIDYRKVRT